MSEQKRDGRRSGRGLQSSHGELYTRKGKRHRKGLWIALALLLTAALFSGFLAVKFRSYYQLSHFVRDEDVYRDAAREAGQAGGVMLASADLTPSGQVSPVTKADAAPETAETDGDSALPKHSGVYNLLLVGVDRRDSSWSGNADSIILISADRNRGILNMVSFMRDLWADIPGYGADKLNAASAYGGCPLLVKTLEENYRVPIDNYVSIDYGGMVALIDALGGVQIELTDEEAEHANGLIRDMCTFLGGDPEEHYFSGGGTCLCDGYQATAYSRIRFIGNSDYERTHRQRTVMLRCFEKVKSMNLKELNDFALKVLPQLTHNIDPLTMLFLIPQIPQYAGYEIIESRVPYDGLYHTEGEILVPDMEETRRRINETLYGEGAAL